MSSTDLTDPNAIVAAVTPGKKPTGANPSLREQSTAAGTSGTVTTMVDFPTLERFEPAVLEFIVSLLAPAPSATTILRKAIDTLFAEKWQAKNWSDLMVFTSIDVAEAFAPSQEIPAEATAPVIVKKLGYIVDYARIGVLTETTTMNDLVRLVTSSSRQVSHRGSQPHSPSRRSVQVFDKKAVPTIDKFNGCDEDYFTWKESTINSLETAGFSRFLDDTTVITKHPEVAESVFYSLRAAVHGGMAQSIAQKMLDDKTLNPSLLWSALEAYYDTALNRANVVLFDIRRLLYLRLNPDTTATKFISDYRDCLQRLRKNNARLSDDTDTLHALLLVAIQDDSFEMVRDTIVHKPDLSIDSILTELRERETSLMMKDQASTIGGDGSSTRLSRRVQTFPTKKGGKSSSWETSDRKWSIPRFPDTWKKAFGVPLFKLLLDWRTDAHKGKPQAQLTADYEMTVEKVQRSGQPGNGSKWAAGQWLETACQVLGQFELNDNFYSRLAW